jgi:hypothetical protein
VPVELARAVVGRHDAGVWAVPVKLACGGWSAGASWGAGRCRWSSRAGGGRRARRGGLGGAGGARV